MTYGLGSEDRDLPGFVVLNGGLIPPGGLDCFGSGFLPASYQGSVFKPGEHPRGQHRPGRGHARRSARQARPDPNARRRRRSNASATTTRSNRPSPITNWPSRMQTAVPELMDLDGETAATLRSSTASTTPYRADANLRPPVPAGPAAGRARRAVRRADLPRRRPRPLGPAQQPEEGTRGQRPGRRSADRRAAEGPEVAAACSTRRWSSGRASSAARRWPRAPTAATTTPSASSIWLAGGGDQGRAPSTARRMNTATTPSRTRSRSTTCTPRCSTCWAMDHTRLTFRFGGRDMRLTDVHGSVRPADPGLNVLSPVERPSGDRSRSDFSRTKQYLKDWKFSGPTKVGPTRPIRRGRD